MFATRVVQPIAMPDAPYLREKVGKVWWAFSSALFLSLAASYHRPSPCQVQARTVVVV